MAEEKKVPLSIILRTVDRATAGIKAVNERLDALTKPPREFGKAIKELGEKSGFNKVGEAFHEVGEAGKEVLLHLLEGAAIIGETTHLVLEMVEGFSKLHDTADRLGTEVDLLAGLEYAASKSGSSVEALDDGMGALVVNVGAAKAGTGKMLKFLNEISPAFANQIAHANSSAEALGLIADAAARLPDAARRGKLAAATLGDPKLAPLLARGSKGIQELIAEHDRLSGSQLAAADAAAKVDDVLKELHASTDGVKAALVTGLAPALEEVIKKLTEWLVDHRADVARWAEDIGKKIPDAVDEVVKAVKGAVTWVAGFVDDIGGWKVAAVALAAVLAGPLVTSLAALSVAIVATPFGWIIAGVAALTLGIIELVKHWDDVTSAIERAKNAIGGFLTGTSDIAEFAQQEIDRKKALAAAVIAPVAGDPLLGLSSLAASWPALEAARTGRPSPWTMTAPFPSLYAADTQPVGTSAAPQQETRIKIDFMNAPRGLRATAEPGGGAGVELTVGYQLAGGGV